MFTTLHTELQDGIYIITINRPEKLNALNKDVFTDIEKAVQTIQTDPNIKAAIITGSGKKAFAAGADIAEFEDLSKAQAIALAKRGLTIFSHIETSNKPIIAAVNGFALGGGCELALACHFRICSTNAKFGQPEVNLGLIPGYGGTQRLAKLIGKGMSMEMHLTGEPIDAEHAYRLGLVNHVTDQENLIPVAIEILKKITHKAPLAISRIIECIHNSEVLTTLEAYNRESEAFGECFTTADAKEGYQAFMEKRQPEFKGK